MHWLMVGCCRNIKGGGFAEWPAARCPNTSSNPLNGSVKRKQHWCSLQLERDTKPATNAIYFFYILFKQQWVGQRVRGVCWAKKRTEKKFMEDVRLQFTVCFWKAEKNRRVRKEVERREREEWAGLDLHTRWRSQEWTVWGGWGAGRGLCEEAITSSTVWSRLSVLLALFIFSLSLSLSLC